jgi:hypothetical protein
MKECNTFLNKDLMEEIVSPKPIPKEMLNKTLNGGLEEWNSENLSVST